jgi:DNA (cytosine-5)-methyltransferase 1
MREVEEVPYNGYAVASTFSGCGGSSLGYRMAGFRVAWANEFVAEARGCYVANSPQTILDPRDIRDVKCSDVLDAIGVRPGDLDVLDGSPPCSAFSTAGSLSDGWGRVKRYSETEQRTDDLFFEYARLLEGIKPKSFIAENVSGLVRGCAKGYFKLILARLRACGYVVEARLLDAAWLGVPQSRKRVIFVGVRSDLGLVPSFPLPLRYFYSLSDAWGSLPSAGASPPECSLAGTAIGRESARLLSGGQSKRYFQLVRARFDRPSPTVTATGGQRGAAGVIHPTDARKFTMPELKRLCSFPDDFVLTGTYQQQWERLGRSVPPVMMSHVAASVRDGVLAKIGEKPCRAKLKIAQSRRGRGSSTGR